MSSSWDQSDVLAKADSLEYLSDAFDRLDRAGYDSELDTKMHHDGEEEDQC